MLLCHVTSHVPADKDQGLLKEKGGTGFPFLVWMNAEGAVILKQGSRTVGAFQKTAHYLELKAKLAAGDATVAPEVMIVGVELGDVAAEQAQKDRGGLALDEGQNQRLDAALFHAEIRATVHDIGRDGAKKAAAAKAFLAHYRAGKSPSDSADWQIAFGFWQLLLGAAEDAADVATYEGGVKAIETLFARNAIKNPSAQKYLASIKDKLAAMKVPAPPK